MFLMRNFPNSMASILVSILTALMVIACGGSGDSESGPTGRLSFQLQWDRTSSSRTGLERAGTDDCADVATVTAAAYDTSGGLLQTGGPWDCTDGQGTLTRVPANREVRVAIAGHDGFGTALYRGESSGTFYLPGGGSVDAGLITAGAYAATLTSPADADMVPVTNVILTWNAVPGADHYVVQVAQSSLFTEASILETLTVDASASPSCRPDPSNLTNVEGTYYWRVQVVDGAGNASNFSIYRYFYITEDVLNVAITSPAAATVQLGDTVTFTATVTDAGGSPLTAADLNSISWWSNQGYYLSTTELSFSTNTLTAADHNISLYVSQPSGYYGSTFFALRVNNPPTATIVFPSGTYQQVYGNPLTCTGEGLDQEDGDITSTLQWELFDPNNVLRGTGVGGNPTFDGTYFDTEGIYILNLQVTDQDGGTGTDTFSFLNILG